jgi:hypothetical protein
MTQKYPIFRRQMLPQAVRAGGAEADGLVFLPSHLSDFSLVPLIWAFKIVDMLTSRALSRIIWLGFAPCSFVVLFSAVTGLIAIFSWQLILK